MCLAIPGRVVAIGPEDGLLMGKVDFGGVCRKACLEHVPGVQVGNYVIVHVGFALSVLDETEAQRVFTYLERMNELVELRGPEPSSEEGDSL